MKTPLADRMIQKERAQRQAGTRRLWRRVGLISAACVGVAGAVGLCCFLPVLLFWGPVILGPSQMHIEAAYEDLPQKAQEFATPEGSDFVFHTMYSGSKVAMKYSCTRQQFEDWAKEMEYGVSHPQLGDTIQVPAFFGWSNPHVHKIEVRQEGVLQASAQWRAGVVFCTFMPDRQEVLTWATGW